MIINLSDIILNGGGGGTGSTCPDCADYFNSGYTSGETAGFESGYTQAYSGAYDSGFTNGVATVPLTSAATSFTQSGTYSIIPPQGYSGLSQCSIEVNATAQQNTGFTSIYYINSSGTDTSNVLLSDGLNRTSNALFSGNTFEIINRGPMIEWAYTSDSEYQKLSAITYGEGTEYVELWENGMSAAKKTSLKSVTLPSSVRVIEFNGYRGFSNLSEVNFAPNSKLESIGANAFSGCTSLTSITLPNTVRFIGFRAFDSSGLQGSFTIPDSVVTVCNRCLTNCTGLTSLTIGSSVTYISKYMLDGCSNLVEINYTGTMAQWNDLYKDSSWNNNVPATVVHCTDGDVSI